MVPTPHWVLLLYVSLRNMHPLYRRKTKVRDVKKSTHDFSQVRKEPARRPTQVCYVRRFVGEVRRIKRKKIQLHLSRNQEGHSFKLKDRDRTE
jgi:hypothetical protein